jgi:hypothetical protein
MRSVAKKMLMNRRLRHSEAEIWTSIPCSEINPEDAPLAGKCFSSFLELENSLAYVASVDSQLVGGTALYRDRKRLSIGLVAVRMPERFRADTLQHLIKSSLPFFRTAAIREVDALVTGEDDRKSLAFPIGYELAGWTVNVLKELGFQETGKMYSCRIDDISCQSTLSSIPKLQERPSLEDFRQLVWKNRQRSGASCPQTDAALSLSHNLNALHEIESKSGKRAMFTLTLWDKVAKIDSVEAEDTSMLKNELVDGLSGMMKSSGSSSILMPLLGPGQRCLAEALADACGSKATFRTLKLMRKPL